MTLKQFVPLDARIVSECGKMLFLDRLLIKLFKTGHRVLLFSTMTKVLDLLEAYLRWRTVDGACAHSKRSPAAPASGQVRQGLAPLQTHREHPREIETHQINVLPSGRDCPTLHGHSFACIYLCTFCA